MTHKRLVSAGLLCLGLAVLLHPDPPERGEGVLGAIGRSMGGSRVMVIDALFLRAEAQRKAGRIEDAAALYQTVLDLDPANEPATIFLVNVYVDELVGQSPDPVERHKGWLAARALLDEAIARRPESASLHFTAATILKNARLPGGALAHRPAAAGRAAARKELRHIRLAVRAAATLPRAGHAHLVHLTLLAPEVAAEALRDGDAAGVAEALATGREALALRGRALRETSLLEGLDFPLDELLRVALDAVAATRDALSGTGEPATARARIAALHALYPDWNLDGLLEGLLDK